MIIEKFFPTFVYGKDVQLDNNKLAQDIINWSNQDPGVKKTNYNGWHSTTDMHTKQEYQQLVTELMRMQKEIYNNEHLDRYAKLGNMWKDFKSGVRDIGRNIEQGFIEGEQYNQEVPWDQQVVPREQDISVERSGGKPLFDWQLGSSGLRSVFGGGR